MHRASGRCAARARTRRRQRRFRGRIRQSHETARGTARGTAGASGTASGRDAGWTPPLPIGGDPLRVPPAECSRSCGRNRGSRVSAGGDSRDRPQNPRERETAARTRHRRTLPRAIRIRSPRGVRHPAHSLPRLGTRSADRPRSVQAHPAVVADHRPALPRRAGASGTGIAPDTHRIRLRTRCLRFRRSRSAPRRWSRFPAGRGSALRRSAPVLEGA